MTGNESKGIALLTTEIRELRVEIGGMKDEVTVLSGRAEFWHKPTFEGQKSRAERVDELLNSLSGVSLTGRIILRIAAAIVVIGGAWAAYETRFRP